MNNTEKEFAKLQKAIGITFKNQRILKQVFVHKSYLNENVGFDLDHNERLEFLGDAVLELITTEHLYKKYKNPEGDLTNWRSALVKGVTLAQIAKELELGENLYLSRGEEKAGGKERELILANTMEALIGAIYLDQGTKVAKEFITKFVLSKLPEILEKKLYIDSKSRLQELSQAKNGITPDYRVMDQFGPDHAKNFTVGAFIGDTLVGQGSGSSKQLAQQAAADNALENWTE